MIWLKTCQLQSWAARLFVIRSKLRTEDGWTYVDSFRDRITWTWLRTSHPTEDNKLLGLHRMLAHQSELWMNSVKVTLLQVKPNCMMAKDKNLNIPVPTSQHYKTFMQLYLTFKLESYTFSDIHVPFIFLPKLFHPFHFIERVQRHKKFAWGSN